MDEVDKKILHTIQESISLEKKPFKEIGVKLGISESEVLHRLRKMKDEGVVRKIGGILNPKAFGYKSTLLAVECPKHKIDEIAKVVNEYEGVTHNYMRDDELNLWFTLNGKNESELRKTLCELKNKIPYRMVELPTLKKFKIGVKFAI